MSRSRLCRLVFGVFALLAAPCAVSAEGLQGIQTFQLFATGFEKQASQACGLQADEMKAAFLAPLEAAGVEMAVSSEGYWVALQVTTALRQPATCATFIDASVLQTTQYYDKSADKERQGKVLLWTHGELVLSDRGEHSAVVHDVFRDLGHDLTTAWRATSEAGETN